MTPSKSMPQKNGNDFEEKYPYVSVVTLVSMRITDIITKLAAFCHDASFYDTTKIPYDIELVKR